MNEETPRENHNHPLAHMRRRYFSAIWLIPIVAAFIALYLGWHDYAEHGPLVDVTFKTGQGLVPGQTQVKYKDVPLGTVESVRLTDDKSAVEAGIRMAASAKPLLTENAQFWVVRPNLNSFNATELETLVTGSYIQIEPGDPDRADQRKFTGLENPPANRRDEPGRTFTLKTDRLGSVSSGSPVYFRDINVGETLGYDLGDGFSPITLTIFVHEPFAHLVRGKSRFWADSGFSLSFGPDGLHAETHSLRSVFTGAIAFATPPDAEKDPPADPGAVFTLYADEKAADAGAYHQRLAYASYFQASVKALTPGAPVLLYGLQVGDVTDVQLLFDAQSKEPKVRVGFEIEPERAFQSPHDGQTLDAAAIVQELVAKGMRVKLASSNLLLGGKELSLEFVPNADDATMIKEGDTTILPSDGSTDNVMDALGDVASKLAQIPFDDIGKNLDHLISSADRTISGADVQQAVHNLSLAMTNAADLSKKANENMTPALQKLPDISQQLQSAVDHANGLFAGLDGSYGQGSDFSRSATRVLDQVEDAARSIRLLADFLERHPEAFLTGKSNEKDKP